MRKLRIATFVTSHFTIPGPKGIIYAPLDVASELCSELARRGHYVDFFAPAGSRVAGCNMIDLEMPPLNRNFKKLFGTAGELNESDIQKIYNLWDQYFLSEIYKRAISGKYDVVHIHPIDRALPFSRMVADTPTVYTLHDPIDKWRADFFDIYRSGNQHLVSISDAQRKGAPGLKYSATIYNGINMKQFRFSKDHDDYLLFAGRLIDQKGVFEAIQAARLTGSKLYIAGSPPSGEYWDRKIKPNLSAKIKYLGNIPRKKLAFYYRNAKAVLFPIKWEEPFGLVMAEAMACGTPVIAFGRGSVPEIVENGVTGFIAGNVKEMAEGIRKLNRISRAACRARVDDKFSVMKMADGYEKLFLKISKK